MSVSRKKAIEYADTLIATPSAHLRVDLRQGKGGVTLLHRGRALTRCYMTRRGLLAAGFMAQALGVKVPPLGQKITARVSTGVLWRAVNISTLDFRTEESYVLLARLLEEAAMQRGAASDAV